MNIVQPNPFTPKSGLEPRVFCGREYEIDCFKNLLEKVETSYSDHFLVLGDWGVGKTTLLKEFRSVAQSRGILTSFTSIEGYQKEDKVQDGIKDLITQIPRGLPTGISKLKSYAKQIESLGIQFFGAGVSFSRKIDCSSQILLLETLCNLWKDLKDETPLVLVLLDDVQNYDEISEIFTTLKNVLSCDEIIKNTKFLFGLSCTMSMWSQFLQRHHPIGRYFTPRLKLTRLNEEKTRHVISSIMSGSGVAFDDEILKKVYDYTEGHPYELQVLCSHLYNHQIGGRVTEEVWDKSLLDALLEVGEVVFDAIYDQASLKERQILHLMAISSIAVGRKEIADIAKTKEFNLTEDAISMYLNRAVKKGMIRRLDRNRYALLDRFFREYLMSVRSIDMAED